jgi:ABC-type multidrug transport system fused ATPase/permease subunit
LLAVVAVPFVYLFRQIQHGAGHRLQSRIELMSYLAELMPFLPVVHAFHGGGHECGRLRVHGERLYRQDMRLQAAAGVLGPLHRVLGAAAVLAIVVGGVAWHGDRPTEAAWVLPFILLFTRLLPVVNGLQQGIGTIGDGVATYRRFVEEIHALRARAVPDGWRDFPPTFRLLEARAVGFAYDGRTAVVDGVTLSIPRGAHVAFTGPSGSGKSTLVMLLARLYDPTRGHITIDGVPLSEFRLASLRRTVAVVEQSPMLINDSVWANVVYGRADATEAAVWRALRAVHTSVGNLGTMLSGGERQRIALARALLTEPRLLILDEVTSAVDARSEAAIRMCVDGLRGDTTVISVAHRLSTIRHADEIHFVKGGRIVASGTFTELVASSSEFRAFVAMQELSAAPAPMTAAETVGGP